MKQKGININLIFISIFILMAVIMGFFGVQVHKAGLQMQEQVQIEENRRQCERESQILADGSDYLTGEVWHFTVTRNTAHLDQYWHEINVARNREKAIENLNRLDLTEEERGLVEDAKRQSDKLVGGEAWAMRLVADAIGMPKENMPPEVAAVVYTEGEEAFSSEQKLEAASKYIFGEEYTAVKEVIKGDIDSFRVILRERKSNELAEAVSRTQRTLEEMRFLMLALAAVFCVASAFFYIFVIRPFYSYTHTLQRMDENNFSVLPPMGAKETRAFAEAFNRIYSDWREERKRLEEERYRFRVALENTSVVVYEYDFTEDRLTGYGTLGNSETGGKQEWELLRFMKERAREYLGPEELERLKGMLEEGCCSPVELQVGSGDKGTERTWVQLTATPVYAQGRKLVKLIGKVTNIQAAKEKEIALEDERSRDGLTGLYNRESGIRKARDYMAQKSHEEPCGIMLLDMDDFDVINQREGQVFADAVLQNVADILRANTGSDDILARLGGDEFLLFIKGCPKSRATVLGPDIARQIRGLSEELDPDIKISASIGMCVTEVVDEYSGLYRCAESTLNYVKEHGKGEAACYLDTSNELGMMLTQMYPERHRINEIERPEAARADLPSLALDLLGKAKNLDDAVYLLLSRVGNTCGLDRILIVELDAEYLSCRSVYQWAEDPANRLSGEPRYITREELEAITRTYDADGLSEQRVITTYTSMHSILHAAIWNYGSCVGAMSFEMLGTHKWTQEERALLSELTKIISSFTLKARADAVSQAKTDFLSRMSHEIRTPMNAITGMTIIAKTALQDPDRMTDCLNKIDSANKYLLSLINDVLDMSRIESGKLEIHSSATDLKALTDSIQTLIGPQAEEKRLTFEIRNGFGQRRRLMADELRLSQVLVNLLGNAVKFTGEGGRVTLAIEAAGAAGDTVTLCFSVADTGIGISKEAQGRIFNAFEQAGRETASNYGGTGLGLAISSRLVQMMGGSLEVESELGKGSRFYFTVTLALAPEEEPADGQTTEGEETPFDPTGKRLLLAEDNALNQEIAKDILEMHGFAVETAGDGHEALAMFEQNGPGYYDAILMDIRMPVMGGMEATRRIRILGKADSRTIPIIAMTANAFDEDMKKSLDNGMNAHLSKPIDVDALMKTLQKLIGNGRQRAVSGEEVKTAVQE